DARERLQRNPAFGAEERTTQILPVTAHRQRRRADRASEIEGENLARAVTAELHRHEAKQHRFSCPGWSDHKAMAHIPDVERKAERGCAFGLRVKQRRISKMLVAFRSRPHCR